MKFTLKSPCKDCPFRNDRPELKGWLGESRAKQIDSALARDGDFPCHKTLDFDDETGESIKVQDSIFCGGALVYLNHQERLFDNAVIRVAAMFGFFNPEKLDMASPVFKTRDEFINHHTRCRGKK